MGLQLRCIRTLQLLGFTAGVGEYTIHSIELVQTCNTPCNVLLLDDFDSPARFRLGSNLLGQAVGTHGMAVAGVADQQLHLLPSPGRVGNYFYT